MLNKVLGKEVNNKMSQVISAITSSPSSSVVSSTNGQTAVSDQGFGQALLAMLGSGGSNTSSNGSTLSLLTLAGLVEGASSTEIQGEEDAVANLLLDLGAKLDNLEDHLTDDGNLLAVLQNWLQGVQAFLQQTPSATSQAQDGQVEQGLPELAKHPQTITFAIQDAVAQLLASTKHAQAGATNLSADQIQKMLQALQQVLDGASGDSQNTKMTSIVDHASSMASQGNGQNNGQVELKEAVHASKAASHATTQHNDHQSINALQNGQVVTAGQLALRHHVNAEVKSLPTPVPVESFAKEVSGFLVGKFDIVKLQGLSEARISLYPEHLGQVDVKITMQNGQMVAQFVTEHLLAKESLEGQMSQLRAALQAQGIQVTKLEVTQNSSLSSHMYHNESQGQRNGSGQEQGNKRRELQEEDHLLVNDLNEEWNEWMAEVKTREGAYGSSFVARA